MLTYNGQGDPYSGSVVFRTYYRPYKLAEVGHAKVPPVKTEIQTPCQEAELLVFAKRGYIGASFLIGLFQNRAIERRNPYIRTPRYTAHAAWGLRARKSNGRIDRV